MKDFFDAMRAIGMPMFVMDEDDAEPRQVSGPPIWTVIGRRRQSDTELLGFIPGFLDCADPRPAREQINERYAHGGGWSPVTGFTRHMMELTYPGDPPMYPIAVAYLRDEMLVLYPYSFVMIIQPDNSFEVARLD